MAHPPVGPDPARDGWLWSCTTLNLLDRANSAGRRHLVLAW
ncbi:hypothetical protein [Nostoc sp.]